jgi:hypothetical protein
MISYGHGIAILHLEIIVLGHRDGASWPGNSEFEIGVPRWALALPPRTARVPAPADRDRDSELCSRFFQVTVPLGVGHGGPSHGHGDSGGLSPGERLFGSRSCR